MVREYLNTLYVMTPSAHVRLDHDTVKVEADGAQLARVPLHHLGSIILFAGATTTSQVLQRCAGDGRTVVWMDFGGRFKARVTGPVSGNVLLRLAQFQAHASPARTAAIARSIVAGKVRNSRYVVARAARDVHGDDNRIALRRCADSLSTMLASLRDESDVEVIRGIEGQAAALYFSAFGAMVAAPTDEFSFKLRTRRPPRDRINALLSFVYALLTTDCTSACEAVGLDPQIGYLHALRPGRPSLALDLTEEFRAYLADRLVLTLINRRQIRPEHFEARDGGSVMLTDDGRRAVLAAYQTRKQEEVPHPLLKEKTPLGLLPHLQARILARHLRADLETYIPFLA
jgi:CRISPR-associated protein Cas1